jgi:hypothetical protein
MLFAAALSAAEASDDELPIAQQIERFLDGDTDGEELFDALYGSVAEEPIPERLLALFRQPA